MIRDKFIHILFLLIFISCQSSDEYYGDSDSSDSNDILSNTSSTYTHSLSNNPFSGYIVDRKSASIYLSHDIPNKSSDNYEQILIYEKMIAAERITGAPVRKLLYILRNLAKTTREISRKKAISENSKLEISIASFKQKQFGMAIYLLTDLKNSKNSKIRAGAYNVLGLIAASEDRLPEAVEYWKKSLSSYSKYEPAILNLVHTYLRFGHFKNAENLLEYLPKNNMIAQSSLVVILKHSGKKKEVKELCMNLIDDYPSHKPSVFNCGIFEWQIIKNPTKGAALIRKALKIPGGPSEWNSHGNRILKRIR